MQPSLAPRKKELFFDVKWFIVAVIVALLLIFQVFPLLYLVYRSVFSTGKFSLEAFQRVYSYPLNWGRCATLWLRQVYPWSLVF